MLSWRRWSLRSIQSERTAGVVCAANALDGGNKNQNESNNKKNRQFQIQNLAMVEHISWVPFGFDREQSGIILTWEKVKVNMDSSNREYLLIPTPAKIYLDTIIPMVNGHGY